MSSAFTTALEPLSGTITVTILDPGIAWQVTTSNGGNYLIQLIGGVLKVTAPTSIQAISAAASIAVAVGLLGGGVSGAGAVATNVILTKTDATIADSVISSATDVTLDATDTALIRAKIITAAAGVGVGFGGMGASIGVAIARNFIGYRADGTAQTAEVHASIDRSSVTAGGKLTLQALSNQTIEALVVAGSVAIAGGLYGFAAAGAGATTTNQIAADVKATISGDGTAATGITAGSIRLLGARHIEDHRQHGIRRRRGVDRPRWRGDRDRGRHREQLDRQHDRGVDHQRRHPRQGDHGRDRPRCLRDGVDHSADDRRGLRLLVQWLVQWRRRAGDEHHDHGDEGLHRRLASSKVESNLAVKLHGRRPLVDLRDAAGDLRQLWADRRSRRGLGHDRHDRRAVDAYIDHSKVTVTTGNVEITATSQATVTADTLTIAIAVALGVAGGASTATATVNGHTQAYLGTLAEIIADAGAVKTNATSNSTATATVDGGGGTIGVTVQQFTGTAHSAPGRAPPSATARRSTPSMPTSAASATNAPSATVQTTAVGLVSSGGVAVTAEDTSTVEAYIGAPTGTTSTAGRNASVTATGSASTIDVKASLIAPVKATGSVLSISLEPAARRPRMRRRPRSSAPTSVTAALRTRAAAAT